MDYFAHLQWIKYMNNWPEPNTFFFKNTHKNYHRYRALRPQQKSNCQTDNSGLQSKAIIASAYFPQIIMAPKIIFWEENTRCLGDAFAEIPGLERAHYQASTPVRTLRTFFSNPATKCISFLPFWSISARVAKRLNSNSISGRISRQRFNIHILK